MTWQLAFGVTLALTFITLILEPFGETHLSMAVVANAVWSLSVLVTATTLVQTAGRPRLRRPCVRPHGVRHRLRPQSTPCDATRGSSAPALTAESLRTRNHIVISVTAVGVVVILASVLVQPH